MIAGRRIFDTHSMRCHGAMGEGVDPKAESYICPPAGFDEIMAPFPGGASPVFAPAQEGAQ